MVRRRGKPRRSYAWLRRQKYNAKFTHHTLPIRFKLMRVPMAAKIDVELVNLDEVEVQTILECQAFGVPDSEIPIYLAFSKRVYKTYMTVWYVTAEVEVALLVSEFILRGKIAALLEALRARMYFKANLIKGILPPAAWTYVDLIGDIWLPEPKGIYGASYDRVIGPIWVAEPSGETTLGLGSGGYYDNRT